MIERRPLSELLGIGLRLRVPHDNETNDIANNSLIIIRSDNGRKVGTVDREDLFDKDGNRFFGDC